jgi:hypothetical protein
MGGQSSDASGAHQTNPARCRATPATAQAANVGTMPTLKVEPEPVGARPGGRGGAGGVPLQGRHGPNVSGLRRAQCTSSVTSLPTGRARISEPDKRRNVSPANAGPVLAVFRFKVGMVPTLAACAVAGVALHLAGLV